MLVLNATGGTKLLAMGFVDSFRTCLEGYPLRVIYTDTAHRIIETIVPLGKRSTPMESVLDIEMYLAVQGASLFSTMSDDERWRSNVAAREDLTMYMAGNCMKIGGFFSILNVLVHGMGNNLGALSPKGVLVRPEQTLPKPPWQTPKELLKHLTKNGLFSWDGATKVTFRDDEYARYIGGLWLEEYAWIVACKAGLQDIRCSVEVHWNGKVGNQAPRNEFDLMAVHENRLLLIECKTGTEPEQTVATRLDSLGRNAGGLFGHSVLLSARKLSDTMAGRCLNLGIEFLDAGDVARLPELIARWRDGGTRPR